MHLRGRIGTYRPLLSLSHNPKVAGSNPAHVGALQHPGSDATVDADALAIGDEAIASGSAAGRCCWSSWLLHKPRAGSLKPF